MRTAEQIKQNEKDAEHCANILWNIMKRFLYTKHKLQEQYGISVIVLAMTEINMRKRKYWNSLEKGNEAINEN